MSSLLCGLSRQSGSKWLHVKTVYQIHSSVRTWISEDEAMRISHVRTVSKQTCQQHVNNCPCMHHCSLRQGIASLDSDTVGYQHVDLMLIQGQIGSIHREHPFFLLHSINSLLWLLMELMSLLSRNYFLHNPFRSLLYKKRNISYQRTSFVQKNCSI